MRHVTRMLGFCLSLALLFVLAPSMLIANGPGRGLTAPFEREYLQFVIDHHFAALRITELAAGTDLTRDQSIGGNEGTAPTPGFGAVPAKATMDMIKSNARKANRAQREEIVAAQHMLREWYGVTHAPGLRDSGRQIIAILEAQPSGAAFEQAYLLLFSRHHFQIAQRSLECLAARDVEHDDLRRYCRSIVDMQVQEIDEMRHMLCRQFSRCDFIPFEGPAGNRD